MIWSTSASAILANPDKKGLVTVSTKLLGREIPVSISKTKKVKRSPYQVKQVLAAIEKLESQKNG